MLRPRVLDEIGLPLVGETGLSLLELARGDVLLGLARGEMLLALARGDTLLGVARGEETRGDTVLLYGDAGRDAERDVGVASGCGG